MDQEVEQVEGLDSDCVHLGHTHNQMMRIFGGATVVNPGRVGLARDGRSEARYVLFENGRMALKRIAYGLDCTLAALRAVPLPADVTDRLAAVLHPQPTADSFHSRSSSRVRLVVALKTRACSVGWRQRVSQASGAYRRKTHIDKELWKKKNFTSATELIATQDHERIAV
jgi:hypothetical protein